MEERKEGEKEIFAGHLLTYKQLAEYLQLCEGTVRNWVSENYIPSIKLRGKKGGVRFRLDRIQKWLDTREHSQ